MSAWNDMKAGFRKITKTVICKTDELADDAALLLKKKTVEAHLSEAYEKLGRVSYRLLSKEGAVICEDEEVLGVSCEITKLEKDLCRLETEIRRKKGKPSGEENAVVNDEPETNRDDEKAAE